MVIIILTNRLTLTLVILILQSNVLTNSYFPPYPNYSFKSFDPPLRPRRSFTQGRGGASGKVGRGPAKEGATSGCRRRARAKGASVWQRRARERERKEWRESRVTGLYWALPRRARCRVGAAVICGAAGPPCRDMWRGRTGPRHRSLPRWQPGRATMHGTVEWFGRAMSVGVSKSVSFEKKQVALKIV